jgi:hypothetical protein
MLKELFLNIELVKMRYKEREAVIGTFKLATGLNSRIIQNRLFNLS